MNTVTYACINVVEHAGPLSPHEVLQMLYTAVLFTRMVLLLCLYLYAFCPLLQFTYFRSCLVPQKIYKIFQIFSYIESLNIN
jgi:hypothetical protein